MKRSFRWLLFFLPSLLCCETGTNTATADNAKIRPFTPTTLGLATATNHRELKEGGLSTSARGERVIPGSSVSNLDLLGPSPPRANHTARYSIQTDSRTSARTLALSDAAITAKSLLFSTLPPGTEEDEQGGGMVAGPPPLAPSTPSSVADAWLICS